jgi:hypothetical protein
MKINVKMVQNASRLILAMNMSANAKMMAILESIVKTVTFIFTSLFYKKIKV